MYKHFLKRLFDIIVSLLALIFLSPLLIVIIIGLFFANKGAGVFFTPLRPGKNGKLFKFLKFKSMTDERGADGKLLPDDKRLTRIGKFVRSTSIDELPQLFNVLKGDMSFVGPRPLAASYLPYYNEEEMHRHDVRPGITGLAQINGRTSVTWPEKLAYDIEYVNKMSFWLDLKILFLTFYKVLKREGVGVEDSGHYGFYLFREEQWAAEGRQDLIDAAREKSMPYRLFK
ncbi:MAG: sugar transferase [Bacteroidaceae bacterium]|nr:sugar transferase [Bacteroidaceae bacterium]